MKARSLHLPPACIVPADGAERILSERARTLAQASDAQATEASTLEVVVFSWGGIRCALELAAVERAVPRLGPVTSLVGPRTAFRGVSFVEHQPRLVVQLPDEPLRPAAELARQPALLLRATGAAALAVSVEGPLELAEANAHLQPFRDAAGAGDSRLAGQLEIGSRWEAGLSTGMLLVSTSWLEAWARGLAG